jgi:hypothetical protein
LQTGKTPSEKTADSTAAEAKLIEQTKKTLDKPDKPEDAFAALAARFDALKKR